MASRIDRLDRQRMVSLRAAIAPGQYVEMFMAEAGDKDRVIVYDKDTKK